MTFTKYAEYAIDTGYTGYSVYADGRVKHAEQLPNSSKAGRRRLWLGTWESQFVFRDLEPKPLSDAEADELSKSIFTARPFHCRGDIKLDGSLIAPRLNGKAELLTSGWRGW